MNKIEAVLVKITEALGSVNVLWGVGASVLLYQYRLVESPSDIDIVISASSVKEVDRVLSAMGEKLPETKSDIYLTEYFYEYIIDGINVDVMAGLKINSSGVVFEYPFDKNSVPHRFKIGGRAVPFSTLEDWFVLYQLMPGRETKVQLIGDYLKDNGIEHPALLKRMERLSALPEKIRKGIIEINVINRR